MWEVGFGVPSELTAVINLCATYWGFLYRRRSWVTVGYHVGRCTSCARERLGLLPAGSSMLLLGKILDVAFKLMFLRIAIRPAELRSTPRVEDRIEQLAHTPDVRNQPLRLVGWKVNLRVDRHDHSLFKS